MVERSTRAGDTACTYLTTAKNELAKQHALQGQRRGELWGVRGAVGVLLGVPLACHGREKSDAGAGRATSASI